jgi:hypothetical protein
MFGGPEDQMSRWAEIGDPEFVYLTQPTLFEVGSLLCLPGNPDLTFATDARIGAKFKKHTFSSIN